MITYKLTAHISFKFFNLRKVVNNLDLDLFLAKLDSLPSKCKNSPFVDRRHKHIVTYDTQITRNNVLGTNFMKETKYRELRSIDLEKAKLCILEGLDKCI